MHYQYNGLQFCSSTWMPSTTILNFTMSQKNFSPSFPTNRITTHCMLLQTFERQNQKFQKEKQKAYSADFILILNLTSWQKQIFRKEFKKFARKFKQSSVGSAVCMRLTRW